MAISNFNKNLWSSQILMDFHNVSVLDNLASQPFEKNGQYFYYNRGNAVDVKDYEGTVNYDALDGSVVEFKFDKKKYFALTVDDVDAVQVAPNNLMGEFTKDAGYRIAEAYDKNGFDTMVKNVKTGNKITISATTTPEALYDLVVKLAVKIDKAKAPKTERYVVMNSELASMLCLDQRFTEFKEVLTDGVSGIGKVKGMTIVESEEVADNTVIAFHKSALVTGKQIDKTEALRLESSFADAVRGLTVYGATVVRPESIAVGVFTA